VENLRRELERQTGFAASASFGPDKDVLIFSVSSSAVDENALARAAGLDRVRIVSASLDSTGEKGNTAVALGTGMASSLGSGALFAALSLLI
jgi:hypothetical protein